MQITFRSRREIVLAIVSLVVGALGAAAIVAFGTSLPIGPRAGGAAAVFVVAAIAAALRWRHRVSVDEDGLIAYGPWLSRSHRCCWDDIDHIVPEDQSMIVLRDGTEFTLTITRPIAIELDQVVAFKQLEYEAS